MTQVFPIVVARELLQGRFDIFFETGIAEIGLASVFPAGSVRFRLLGNRPACFGPGDEGADSGGVDDREFIDLDLVEGLPLPLVISARGVFSETDELLPPPQEFALPARKLNDELSRFADLKSIRQETPWRVRSATNACPAEELLGHRNDFCDDRLVFDVYVQRVDDAGENAGVLRIIAIDRHADSVLPIGFARTLAAIFLRDAWIVPVVDSDRLEPALEQALTDRDDLFAGHGTSSQSASALDALNAAAFSRMRAITAACFGEGKRVPRAIRSVTKLDSQAVRKNLEPFNCCAFGEAVRASLTGSFGPGSAGSGVLRFPALLCCGIRSLPRCSSIGEEQFVDRHFVVVGHALQHG